MSLLTLDGVSKSFGGITAVADLSFTVDRGQVVGFLGPNGAGKSTTMRMITQYLEPDGGDIRLDGVPLGQAGRDAKRRIGYLPENNPLYADMLVSEYLDFAASLRELNGPEKTRAIERTVAATGIEGVFFRPIGELSKGYRQRAGLAQAMLHEPDILILDEPTEGLDPNQRIEIRRLIGDLGKDRTVILSTHVLPEVQHTCSRLIIINQGRIAAEGGVTELVARAEGAVQIHVEAKGSRVAEALRGLPGVRRADEASRGEGRVEVAITADGARDLRPLVFDLAKSQGWTLYELHQEAGSLESLFRHLTTGAPDEAAREETPA